jgi:hypothetical protein
VYFFLGPKITCDLEFDKHCVFASNIDLTGRHIADLNAMVAKLRTIVPYYICEMKKSNILRGKEKMVFCLTLLIFLCTLICIQQLTVFLYFGTFHLSTTMPTSPAIFHSPFQHIAVSKMVSIMCVSPIRAKVLQQASIEEGNVCIFTFLNVGQEAMSIHVAIMKSRSCLDHGAIGHVVIILVSYSNSVMVLCGVNLLSLS